MPLCREAGICTGARTGALPVLPQIFPSTASPRSSEELLPHPSGDAPMAASMQTLQNQARGFEACHSSGADKNACFSIRAI